MEVINKRHDDISSNRRVDLAAYMRLDEKILYFSAACNFELGIMGGLNIHFINDDDRWLFYLNSDKDGFLLCNVHNKNSCMVISTSLCLLFRKRTKCAIGSKFPIVMTKAKKEDAPIYEIMINKAFETE
jgi:hypothetical protein